MRILILNWLDRENPASGGAEVHLHESFGRLARRAGWQVTAVTSGWPGSASRSDVDGLEIHRVGGRHSYLFSAPRYVRSLPEGSFDLVVEDLNKVPLFVPRWSSAPALLLVHHLFGATAFKEATLPIAAATWLLERPIPRVYRDTPVVAVSESTRDDLVKRGMDSSVVEVIENGVDIRHFTPIPFEARFEEPTLLYLGRLKKYKRLDLVFEAVARLRRNGTPVRLLIAGRGDHRLALEREADRLGLGSEAVRFLGFVDEPRKLELLRRAWVHVLTSPKEGWGISNLEAAACATPSVASDSPGLRDSVRDGQTGFLTPHGDVVTLVSKLGELLENRGLRQRMGAEARKFAEHLSWDRTTERLASALGRAVASGSRSE